MYSAVTSSGRKIHHADPNVPESLYPGFKKNIFQGLTNRAVKGSKNQVKIPLMKLMRNHSLTKKNSTKIKF